MLAWHNSGSQAAVLLARPSTGDSDPPWLRWGKALMALSQNGLTYSDNPFDRERYEYMHRIAAEMLAEGSGDTIEQIEAFFSGEVGHATPKVDVRGVVFKDEAILLVKERADGLWTVPGGWADIGESPGAGAAREVWEESGYKVRPVKLLAVYDRNKHNHPPHQFHIYKLFYLCELTGGEAVSSIETDGVGFFREDEIPPLSTGRVTREQIARFFEHYRHPEWPTDFD